jgi:hypothetical protein
MKSAHGIMVAFVGNLDWLSLESGNFLGGIHVEVIGHRLGVGAETLIENFEILSQGAYKFIGFEI